MVVALVKCLDCDTMLHPSPNGKGPPRLRCDVHRTLRKKQLQRARTAQLRAQEWGVVTELIIADEVFERDDWVCHLCGEPVPENLRTSGFRSGIYEPLAPVVDHVVPLSKGGPHTMDNCRLAHWTCNAKKFDREGLSAAEAEPIPDIAAHVVNKCSVEGCGREVRTKRLCVTHYQRNYRFGNPLTLKCGCGCGEFVSVDPSWTGLFYIDGHGVQSNAVEPAELLRQNLVAQPVSSRGSELYGLTDDCQIWTGPKVPKGYGVINIRAGKRITRRELVHRMAYQLAHGEGSLHGLTVDHLCGVPLCCNPNHLEAVTNSENTRRAALVVTACPKGHAYDEENTLYAGDDGHRVCRQCNRNRYHLRTLGHDFVLDPENSSTKRQRCLTCRLEAESKPAFCPHGHEFTPENKKIDGQGKRVCIQCTRNRSHIASFGHEFVIDPSNPSPKRQRCLICVKAADPVTHCLHGHEYTELTTEFSPKGHRKCVQCRLNKTHVPRFGHEYAIDPAYKPGSVRRCMICEQRKEAERPTHCVNGHEFTPQNTEYHSTRGNRICLQCRLDSTHVPTFGHSFVVDPNHTGKLRRCVVCRESRNRKGKEVH